ncbi:MAG: hypothetical protein Tsb0013_24980 [Phycisphaerales bacterium]
MSFTGKATYDAGATLPELAEDVSDVIGIVSPYETALLDHLGDPRRPAMSTVHEWLEDELLPNRDVVDEASFTDPSTDAQFGVANASYFRVGDQVRAAGSAEVMLVVAKVGGDIVVTRGYGGTTPEALSDGQALTILGNAALEGASAGESRTTARSRRRNYTQIFTSSVEVSGSQRAAQTIGVKDELDYQMQERLRELLRDLENCVINGVAPQSTPEGSASVRRTMNGLRSLIQTNVFTPGVGPMPSGGGGGTMLNEAVLNAALREVWEHSSGSVDTILVGGQRKREINSFVGDQRGFLPGDATYKDMISVYESDFGVCRVVMSRWMPADTVLLLDSSRISVMPLSGRSFHFKPLASTGDSEVGQVIGEYTLELMNESAHAAITGLTSN